MRHVPATVLLLATAFAGPAIAQDAQGTRGAGSDRQAKRPDTGAGTDSATDIVGTVGAAGTFGKLVAAVQASGLADTLEGQGPYTLFAPTDAAFQALPDGYVDSLLDPSMHDDLVALLSYHVVPGKLSLADLQKMVGGLGLDTASIETLDGHTLVIDDEAGLSVDGATIVKPDLASTNGVVHGIDTVLLPDAS